jgi:type IV pilus assembly protein PilB
MALQTIQYRRLFVDSGFVSSEIFDRIMNEAIRTVRPPEAGFVEAGIFKDEEIGKLIADAYGINFIHLSQTPIDPEAVKMIPEAFARKENVLAYGWIDGICQVAMVDPENKEVRDFLEKKLGEPIMVTYTTPGFLEEAFAEYSSQIFDEISQLIEQYGRSFTEQGAQAHIERESIIIPLVDLLLRYGCDNHASDIHIEPHEAFTLVCYRVDGILYDLFRFPKSLHEAVVSRIKILAVLRTDEHFTAQDGKLCIRLQNKKDIDVYVSIVPILEGEKVVLRFFMERGRGLYLDILGLDLSEVEKLKIAAQQPYGMILTTGPTGSGKTTMMYALLQILNQRGVNIATIEDPVEYDVEGISQIQVNPRTKLTFATGLRSIVRQDPDIIFVGEVRDEETATIAVNAAMSGHLVLSTLHTNDAATTLPRLLEMKMEPFLIASTINVIVAQRLVRRICRHCIHSVNSDLIRLQRIVQPTLFQKYFGQKTYFRVFAGKGCRVCHNSGYMGRIGIFEILQMTPRIREYIMRRANAAEIQQAAVEEGMTTMMEDGIRKILQGITSVEEVLRVVC